MAIFKGLVVYIYIIVHVFIVQSPKREPQVISPAPSTIFSSFSKIFLEGSIFLGLEVYTLERREGGMILRHDSNISPLPSSALVFKL